MLDSGLASQGSSSRLVRCRRFSVSAGIAFSFTRMTGLNPGTCTSNARLARQNFGSNRLNANGVAASVEVTLWAFHRLIAERRELLLQKWHEFFGDQAN